MAAGERLQGADPRRARDVRRRPARQHQDPATAGPDARRTPSTRSATAPRVCSTRWPSGKITGEEDIWSHTDLYDFQANVDGARVGYEGLKPILEVKDPELSEQIETAFADLQTLLDKYRQGEDDFVFYDTVTPAQRKELSDAVERARRAAVEDDGSHHPVTDPHDQHHRPTRRRGRGRSRRRRLLGAAGAGALAAGPPASAATRGAATEAPPRWRRTARAYPFHGRTRRASSPRSRTGCTSRPSTSRTDLARRPGRPAAGVDGRRAPDDGRRPRRAATPRRRTTPRRPTPARRRDCRRRG